MMEKMGMTESDAEKGKKSADEDGEALSAIEIANKSAELDKVRHPSRDTKEGSKVVILSIGP